jgi:SAM-dependent methyltransferase
VSDHTTPELLEFIHRWLPASPARVVEVGCGDGALTRRLGEEGYGALGVDPEAPEGNRFVRSTLEEFRFEAPLDAAVAIRSLHHLHDPARALDNLRALLKPGGRLVAFEFAVEHVDNAALNWLEARGLAHPVQESSLDEVIPLADLRAELEQRFHPLAAEPASYLAREAGREDLVADEEAALRAGLIKPTGMRLAYERPRLLEAPR